MKYGFVIPPWPVNPVVDFAVEAEDAGWDGFILSNTPWADDAWICLAEAAMRTSRIRLGTLLTPVSCFKPWRLAAETATLDQLSGGRVILSIGLAEHRLCSVRRGHRPADTGGARRRGS